MLLYKHQNDLHPEVQKANNWQKENENEIRVAAERRAERAKQDKILWKKCVYYGDGSNSSSHVALKMFSPKIYTHRKLNEIMMEFIYISTYTNTHTKDVSFGSCLMTENCLFCCYLVWLLMSHCHCVVIILSLPSLLLWFRFRLRWQIYMHNTVGRQLCLFVKQAAVWHLFH